MVHVAFSNKSASLFYI